MANKMFSHYNLILIMLHTNPVKSHSHKKETSSRMGFRESIKRNPKQHFCGAQITWQSINLLLQSHISRSATTLGPDKRLFVI